MNIQDWFPLGSTGLVWSPCSPGDSQESSPAPQFKNITSLALRLLYSQTLTSIHNYWKSHSLTLRTFVGKVMSLFFKTLSWFVIAFLPRTKHLLFNSLKKFFYCIVYFYILVFNGPPPSREDMGSIPRSGRFFWRRAWQSTPLFFPGEPHRQRILEGYGS